MENRVANKILQECCQDILDHVNIELITFRLYSKSRLTVEELSKLESFSTPEGKKKQFFILALANKGYAALEGILQVLDDTEHYKPHADLADKLRKRYKFHTHRLTQGHPDQLEVNRKLTKKRKQKTTDCSLENQLSDDDKFLARSLPDIAIVTASQTTQSCRPRVRQTIPAHAVNPSADHNVDAILPVNKVLSLSVGQGSSPRVPQVSSSIQNTTYHSPNQPPSVKTVAPASVNTGQSVGVTTRLEQSQRINRVTSTSFISNQPTVLVKSIIPLPNVINIKLILLGDSGVGKTSLVQRYIHGIYLDNSPMTVGNKLDQCYYQHIQKDINIKLSVWDTAGQERFNWMSPIYYHHAHAAIVVFDMTQPSSLTSATNWKIELSKHLSHNDANLPVLLIGNKCDSPDVSDGIRRHAREIVERHGFDDFIEASAKDDHKVEEIFEKTVSLAMEYYTSSEDTITIPSEQSQQQQRQRQQQQGQQQRQQRGCKC